MERSIKYFNFSIVVVAMFMLLSSVLLGQATSDITIRPIQPTGKCPNGALDLVISGGVAPYEVDWYWEVRGSSYVIERNANLPGNDGREDLEGLEPGVYRVVITDAACGQIQSTVELQQGLFSDGADRIITERVNVSECTRDSTTMQVSMDGSITLLEVLGLNPPYEVIWNGPGVQNVTGNSITGLGPGTYKIVITTKDGCELSKEIIICCCGSGIKSNIEPMQCGNQEIIFPLSIEQELLFSPDSQDSNNGRIRINVRGGSEAENSIIWTGPDGFSSTSTDLYGLGVGKYCVTVSDGCSEASECFELVDCSARNIIISGTPINTCAGLSFGSISVSATGGAGPYQYVWSNGSRSATLTNLARGNYGVTVSDRNGCRNSASYFVDDNQQIRETRNDCVFTYDCNGNIVHINDIGSYQEIRPTDCRYRDTRCTDGVRIREEFIGTRFEGYDAATCSIKEICILTNQTYRNHQGQSQVVPLEGYDSNNNCWWCHDVYLCEFPSLGRQQVINNVVSHLGIASSPSSNCPSGQYYRVHCGLRIIWEGCSSGEFACDSRLLGLKTEEKIQKVKMADGSSEIRKTYRVVEFDPGLVLSHLQEMGVISDTISLLQLGNPEGYFSSPNIEELNVFVNSSAKQSVELSVYPNPFTGSITLHFEGMASYSRINLVISDSFGKKVYSENLSNDLSPGFDKALNLMKLPGGIYFLSCTFEGSSITKKIIKF